MVDFVAFLIPLTVALGGLSLLLWATTTRRQDARIAQLEAHRRGDAADIVKQFWKHETAIQQNAATAATAEREIVQLAIRFARMSDPLGKTIAETVHTQRTLVP